MNSPIGEFCQWGSRQLALFDPQPVKQLRPMAMPELKRRRKAKKLTLDGLAQIIGVSLSQIQRFETGEREPKRTELEALARALDCTIPELLGEDASASRKPPRRGDLLPVPLIGRTAAGIFREVVEFDDAEPDYVFEPEDEDYPKARRFALTVEGDSMDNAVPPMPDGARVICLDFEQTGQPFVEGMIVVVQRVREGGHLREWSVKQIELHDDEVWFCPRSTNAKHKPIKIVNDPSDDQWGSIEVIGLVRDVSMKVRVPRPRLSR